MRIVDFRGRDGRPVEQVASRGFAVAPVMREGQVMSATLAAGGVIGRHDAPGPQLLVVLAGEVAVSGAEDEPHIITAGQGALWVEGESHETRATSDATLLLLEGAGITEDVVK